ncbi:sensor histidine kinase [Spirillospora sp. NPDC048911]|uniref:sensor histidine kinase n=1 Tax=Spirillospora sp. NPDC048911 TaxID=3364527 RepID=UPI0037227874
MVLRRLTDQTTWRRWAYLVVGGALLLPYWLLGMVLVGLVPFIPQGGLSGVAVLIVPIFAAFVTGLVPTVRPLESTAARELLRGASGELNARPPDSWESRARAGAWFSLHLHVGVVIAAMSLAIPPFAIGLLLFPFVDWGLAEDESPLHGWKQSAWEWLGPPAGLLMVLVLLALIIAAGEMLSRLAPIFLGPTPTERLAELETKAVKLAERNRLARELHDSVGHALSVVTLQAGAAGRVLDTDPAFAREALSAIEESARSALEDLDHVLGLLREDASPRTAPQATLKDVDRLLEQTRIAGVKLDAEVDGGVEHVPAAVSREAYRIVQEALTNALRHAGKVPVRLRITVRGGRLEVEVSNPLDGVSAGHHSGGRGLDGIRERVTVLRGDMTAGPDGGQWRVGVSLPLRSGS